MTFLLLLLALETQADPADLIQKLGSPRGEERDEAHRKLKALGKAALPRLREAARSGDSEISTRAKRLIRILEVKDSLPPALLTFSAGIDEKLASDPHEWTTLFLAAAAELQKKEFRTAPCPISVADLESIATEALVRARPEEMSRVSEVVSDLRLRSLIPAVKEMLASPAAELRVTACGLLARFEVFDAAPAMIPLLREARTSQAAGEALVALRNGSTYPSIVGLLSEKDSELRKRVTGVAAALGLRDAVPAIRDMLRDPDATVRHQALDALDTLKDRGALGRILELTQDPDGSVRHTAAFVARHGEEPEVDLAVVEWLRRGDPEVLSQAIPAAAERRVRAAVPLLLKIVRSGDGSIAQQAASALGSIADPDSLPAIKDLVRDKSAEVRAHGLTALSRMRMKEAIPEIELLLADPDARVRSLAVEGLTGVAGKSAAPKIAQKLKDSEEVVRREAITALRKLEAREQGPMILPLLKDPGVAHAALGAIEAFQPEGTLDALLGVLGEDGMWVNHSLLLSLGLKERKSQVRALLKDRRPRARSSAIYLLAELKDTNSIPDFTSMLDQDRDPQVRCAAARALATFKIEAGVAALVKMLDHSETQSNAAWALAGIRGPIAAEALGKGIKDPDTIFRGMLLTRALVECGRDGLPYLLRMLEDPDENVRRDVKQAVLRVDIRGSYPEVIRAMERTGDEGWCWVMVDLAEAGILDPLPLLLRKSTESRSFYRARSLEIAGRSGMRDCIPELRAALKADPPAVLAAAAEALAWMADEESIPAIRKLLDHPDDLARRGAARALCIAGERQGVPLLLGENGFVLNRLRNPDVWKKLGAAPLEGPGNHNPKARLEEFARVAKMAIVFEVDSTDSHDPLQNSSSWRYRRDKRSVLDGLGECESYLEVVLESDRIRILTPAAGRKFWREWWAMETVK